MLSVIQVDNHCFLFKMISVTSLCDIVKMNAIIIIIMINRAESSSLQASYK